MTRFLLLGLLSMVLQAQSAAPPAVGRIAGQVIDDATKAPIAGARVTLITLSRPGGGPVPVAATDSAGRFAFDQLAPGSYAVQVTKGGYATATARPRPIEVTAGTNVGDLVYALQRGGAISGRVVDANGDPVIEVRVGAQRATATGQPGTFMQSGPGAQTNDLGEYRLYGLEPGDYYVQAGGAAAMPLTAVMASQLAPTFHPSAREAVDGLRVSVFAGQTTGNVDIRMDVEPLFQIRGIAVDAQGAPIEGAIITIAAERRTPAAMMMMGPMNRMRSQRDGSFVITNVPAGEYRVGAAVPRVDSWPTPGSGGGGSVSATASGGFGTAVGQVGGVGGGVASSVETRDGVTTTSQWQVDPSRNVRVTVSDTDVTGVRVTALPPPAAR